MKNVCILYAVIFLASIASSCKIDDTTPNPTLRLPFENLDELFARQDITADTVVIDASADETIYTSNGANIVIDAGSFQQNNVTVNGNVSVIIKELLEKSDMVLLNKPSTSGNLILEYGGIIEFNAYKNNAGTNLQNAISVTLPVSDQISALNEMSHYKGSGGWTFVNNSPVIINSGALTLRFNTEDEDWMCGAMQPAFNNLTTVTASPFGYGTVLTDIAGFVVLSDYNTVIKMDGDLNGLKVSQSNIPKGVEASIVILAMDHFTLFVGVQTLEITDNLSTEIRMTEVSEDDLSDALQIVN